MKRLETAEQRQQFVDDWNNMVATVAEFSNKYDLGKPDMVYPPEVHTLMNSVGNTRLLPTVIWQGVRVRFGRFEQADTLRQI